MKKVVVFGNSSSGKSTFARELSKRYGIAHLDLDTIAWQNSVPPTRSSLSEAQQHIDAFVSDNADWVIEGCYSDLLELVIEQASEIVYLNLPTELCVQNAKQRPWEPHKYETKQAQDANLPMLIDWIEQYYSREDVFSHQAHTQLYEAFSGNKTMYSDNVR